MDYGAIIGAAMNMIGGMINNETQGDSERRALIQNQQNLNMQKEFAQQGIRWRVEDAKAAGLHPLAALGAQTTSYYPQTVDFGQKDYSWIGRAGQDIGRAVSSELSTDERQKREADLRYMDARATNMELQNTALQNQINAQSQQGPALNMSAPWMGQNSENIERGVSSAGPLGSGNWQPNISKVDTSDSIGKTAGPPGPLETDYVDADGNLYSVIAQSPSEGFESDTFSQSQRFFKKAYEWGRGLAYRGIDKVAGAGSDARNDWNSYVDELHAKQADLERRYPLKDGQQWRYNSYWGNWQIMNVGDSTGLFTDD